MGARPGLQQSCGPDSARGEIESVPPNVVHRATRLFPKFHTPDFRKDRAYKSALRELTRLLRAPVPDLGLLSGVPALAPHLELRLDQVLRLEELVLSDALVPDMISFNEGIGAIAGISLSDAALRPGNLAKAT